MAKRSTSSDKVILDPIFAVPEGAEDEFTTPEDFDYNYPSDELALNEIETQYSQPDEYEQSYDESYEDADDKLMATPDVFDIIQTLRRGPGGQQVVDVVIDVEDVNQARYHEIEVTKI